MSIKKFIISNITLLGAIFMFILLGNITPAYAAETDYEVFDTIDLGDGYEIVVYADLGIDYDWDEGAYGWINDVTIGSSGGAASDNVYIDDFYLVDYSDGGSASYWFKYYFYGFQHGNWYNDYSGYVYFNVYCDEWGDISVWVTYEAA